MSKRIFPIAPEINRLRATAALIPIIESGLLASKLSIERAALMASFCDRTVEQRSDDPNVVKLAEAVGSGLQRIKMALSSAPAELGVDTLPCYPYSRAALDMPIKQADTRPRTLMPSKNSSSSQ